MTIEEMSASTKNMLTPNDVCEVLGCSAYSINVQCRDDPDKLGFPVCMVGTRVRIPRIGFLRWLNGPAALPPEAPYHYQPTK